MTKIEEMSEGIVVEDAPPTKTTMGGVMAKGKKGVANGRYVQIYFNEEAKTVFLLT